MMIMVLIFVVVFVVIFWVGIFVVMFGFTTLSASFAVFALVLLSFFHLTLLGTLSFVDGFAEFF